MVGPLPSSVNTFDPTAEPVLYTTKGNIPLSLSKGENPRLVLRCRWEEVPGHYTKCFPEWFLDGELVQNDCYILSRRPLTITSETGNIT